MRQSTRTSKLLLILLHYKKPIKNEVYKTTNSSSHNFEIHNIMCKITETFHKSDRNYTEIEIYYTHYCVELIILTKLLHTCDVKGSVRIAMGIIFKQVIKYQK